MKKLWEVTVTMSEEVEAETKEEAIDLARQYFPEVGSDAMFDADEIPDTRFGFPSRTSEKTEE